jgi:hypothetical protein
MYVYEFRAYNKLCAGRRRRRRRRRRKVYSGGGGMDVCYGIRMIDMLRSL